MMTLVFVTLFFWLYRPGRIEGLIIASGWLTFVVGWHLGLGLLGQAQDAIERLRRRQVLEGSDVVLKTGIARSVALWSRRGAWATALAILSAFAADSVEYWFLNPVNVVLVLSETVAGFFAGRILGQMIAVGTLGTRIKRGEWMLRPQPGHIDGAAGLKPVGDLYFREAMVLAIPALFLAVWSVLSPDRPGRPGWHEFYLGLLVAVVAIEVSVFVLPMVSFHGIMTREKRKLLVASRSVMPCCYCPSSPTHSRH